jgi:hypothetical protein
VAWSVIGRANTQADRRIFQVDSKKKKKKKKKNLHAYPFSTLLSYSTVPVYFSKISIFFLSLYHRLGAGRLIHMSGHTVEWGQMSDFLCAGVSAG